MTIHSSAQIGQIIRNAVAFGAQNWRGVTMNTETLVRSVQEFFDLLEQRSVPYVLAGEIALLHYIEGAIRSTSLC